MAGGHSSHDEFFTRLGELFESRKGKDKGAIYLSQKRLTYTQPDVQMATAENPFPDLNPEKPLPILVRATNGASKTHRASKLKLSTVVEPDALEGFYARYAELCKAGMTSLKPRDRSKKSRKAKSKKKGGAAAPAS